MRLCDRLPLVAALFAAFLASCGSGSKKDGDGGNPDSLVFDAALPDVPDSDLSDSINIEDSNLGQADAGIPDLASGDAFCETAALPVDAWGIEGSRRTMLILTPASASFQTVVGTTSSPATFYVVNAGDVNSAIPVVTITGTHADDFSFTSDCVMALFAGATSMCQVKVIYNPKTSPTTNSSATLTVVESGGGSSASAALTGTALVPGMLTITGATTDFGTVVGGSVGSALFFTVTNTGDLESGGIKVSANPSPFAIGTDNCTGRSLTAKTNCTFTVTFAPSAKDMGFMPGQIKATGASVADPASLSVSANAVPTAKLTIGPFSVEFGSYQVLHESPPLTFTISNTGGAPTGPLKVDSTGAPFSTKGNTCTGAILRTDAASNSCTIVVTYTATSAYVESTGHVTISDPAGTSAPVTGTMHGIGGTASH